jgi:MFS family permease
MILSEDNMFFSRKKERLRNRSRHIYLITNALIMLSTFMLVPIYALFVTSLGGTVLHASIIAATFYLTASIGALVFGRLIDKYNHDRLFLMAGYLIISSGYLLLLFATSFWHLIFIQIYLGIADAIIYPAFDTLFARHLNRKEEHAEWAALESTRYLTMFVGASIGGVIVNWAGFNVLFVVMACICFASFINMVLTPKELQ